MIVNFLALLIVCFSFSGCSKKETPSGTTLRLNIFTDPPSLDPRTAMDLTSFNVLTLLNEGLFRQNPDGEFAPALAESYHLSDDGLKLTLTLRKAYWSNGDPIEAEDFAYAWRWRLLPENPALAVHLLYIIKNAKAIKTGKLDLAELGVKVIDPKTLEITFEKPIPYIKSLLALPFFYAVHKKTAEKDKNWANKPSTYISNGPYVFVEWKHNDRILLEKNAGYWDAANVRISNIQLHMIENAATELSMFEQGELDWAGTPLSVGLPNDAIPSLKDAGKLISEPWATSYNYAFNTAKPPFNHPKMRRAFAYAINRKDIVDHITQAGETPALSITSPLLAFEDKAYIKDNNVDEARKLFHESLDEMGLTKESLPKIQLVYNSSESHHRLAQAIQQQWQKVFGISIQLENKEWKVFLEQMNNRDFMIAKWNLQPAYADPLSILESLQYGDDNMNPSGWHSKEYDRLLEESFFLPAKERAQHLMKAEEIAMAEMPLCPIYSFRNNHLQNPKLKGVYLSPIGLIDFKWAYFSEDSN